MTDKPNSPTSVSALASTPGPWVIAAVALLVGCSQPPPDYDNFLSEAHGNAATPAAAPLTAEEQAAATAAQAELNAEIVRERQIEEIRRRDPAVNWVNIGISTGKFSESIGSTVHQTHEECIRRSAMEDNECFPIPALPDSYWKASPDD